MPRIIAAILLVAVLAIGGGHHRHDRLPGRSQHGGHDRPPQAAPSSPRSSSPPTAGYGWHPFGFGFGFFGFLATLFFLFLVFGAASGRSSGAAAPAGAVGWGRAADGSAYRRPGARTATATALGGRVHHDTFDDWHRGAHGAGRRPGRTPPADADRPADPGLTGRPPLPAPPDVIGPGAHPLSTITSLR